MRIILADNRKEVRSGLKLLLEQEPDIDIVGEVSNFGSLISQTSENSPDLVLLDWELTGMRVMDIIPVLRSLCPKLKIVALSGRPESHKSAKAAGADAFVSKGDYPEKLLETVRRLVESAVS